jgi:hypothetical protein
MNKWLLRTLKFAALTTLGGTALMQAEQATFHLPVTAHWAGTVLQPGDYKMQLPDLAAGRQEFLVQGSGKTVFVNPQVTDLRRSSDTSHLELTEVNGEYFIRSYFSELTGKQFTFSAPKMVHRMEANRLAVTTK